MSVVRVVTALLLCLLASAAAAAPGIELRVDTRQVRVGESFTVSVLVTSPGSSGAEAPRLAVGEAFQIVKTSRSASLDFQGGEARVHTTFIVRARRGGMYTFGPASVVIGGRTYRSDTVTLSVLDPSGAASSTPSGASPAAARREPKTETLILALTSSDVVYLGEQLTVTVRLLTKVRVSNVRLMAQPNLAGFWLEEIPVPGKPPREKESYQGVRYDAYTLRKLALFPTTSGELTLEPFRWELTLITTDFFFPERRLVQLESEPITVRVRPLPERGKPSDFRGAVGSFELEAELDRQQGTTEDAFVLTVRVSGRGNIKTLPEPVLPELGGFKPYASTSQEEPTTDGVWLGGTKIWEYVLLPRSPGEHVIPALELPVFDPAEGAYRLLVSRPLSASVQRGSGAAPVASGADSPGGRNEVRVLARDINYIKLERGEPSVAAVWLGRRVLVASVLALPLLANAMALAVVWGRRRSARDPVGRRRRAALKQARRRLGSGSKKADAREVGAGVASALLGYLGDHFDQPPNGLTRERVKSLLTEAGCEPKLADRVNRLLDRCDYLRFAQVGTNGKELGGLCREAEALLKRLERRLRRAA